MASNGGGAESGAVRAPGYGGGRRDMPRPLSRALLLVHALFALTALGGLGLLLTAASLDAVDGTLLAQVAYAAAPGVAGWWLARRAWRGGARVRLGLVVVQAWLVLGSVSNLADGSARGFTQLLLPLLVLYLLTRPESRDWYRLAEPERRERRPFSLPRMIRWRRDDGQTAVEYAGLVAVVAAIVTALVVSGLGGQLLTGIQAQVCRVTGAACPAPGDGGDGQVTAEDGDGGGTGNGTGDATTGGTGNSGGDADGPGDADGTGPGNQDPGNQDPGNRDPGDPGSGDGDGDGGGTDPDDPPADTADDPSVVDPVAAEDEIDEPPYEDPTADGGTEDGGDGGDEGCFSGFGAFFGCAGDQLKQVGEGLFVDGIWGDLTGIWDVVTNPVDTWNGLMDYGRSLGDDWWNDTADAREKWDDGDYLGAVLDWGGASLGTGGTVLFDSFIGDDVVDQWNSGNETRAVTTVVWNVGSLFIPGYGEAKIAEKIGSLGRLSKVVDDATEAAQDARRAAEAGDLDALDDAVRRADEAADEAEDAARRTGCTISAPARGIPYGEGPHPGTSGGPGTGTTVLAVGPVARSPYVVLAEGGCDEEARQQAEEARAAERQAYLERKRAAEPDRAREALANRKQYPEPEHGDTSDPRNYNPPDWADDLASRTYGDADDGDGFWASRDRNPSPNWRNESWLRYQEQVTGTQRGHEYVVPHPDPDVPDVEFDGWDSSRQTYLEAKNGYDSFLAADRTELTPSGRERLLTEARRQASAANGKDIEWHFSNQEVADAARDAFEDAGLDIEVVHTAPERVAGDRRPEAFD
ncbi:Tox-REase-5 domain-containing protein [Streptomyces marokkonensis]|uniref:Tox-REase-5 domain-containing protein n=1 Tax=Streptomyces marokkonensis TaxID=324855 RepID=UPI0011F2E8C6|nr:Tox-REase-5 domain-containing protein [Streptomyces marokkonensis]